MKINVRSILIFTTCVALLGFVSKGVFDFIAAAKFKAALSYVGGLRVDICSQRINEGRYPAKWLPNLQNFKDISYAYVEPDSYKIDSTYVDLYGREIHIEAAPNGVFYSLPGVKEIYQGFGGDRRCINIEKKRNGI